MLFRALVWFWKNAVEYPLMKCGAPGRAVASVLYRLLVYIPGMTLALLAYALYPPKVIDQRPVERPKDKDA